MTSPENPFDQTIWDPIDPEQAIEDPMHGPSAVHDILQIPAMPLGDGTYYQTGGYYVHGTPYVDAQERPIYRIRTGSMAGMREGFELKEWIAAYREGEEALTALEAGRQQKRLEDTGLAHCYKPSDICPGGKKLEACETGKTGYEAAQEWAASNNQEKPGQGMLSNFIAWAGGKCVQCSVSCEVAVKTIDGKPQEVRVSFYRPDPNMPVIKLDLTTTMSPLFATGLDKIQLAREFYKGIVDIDDDA